jgi:hypothetical protein
MDFKINPCKAVTQEISSSGCDINNINNLCYGICDSFGRVYGSEVEGQCRDRCANMISRKKKDLGTTDCNKRQPLPPPSWFQVPDYYPELLKETQRPDKAYKMCQAMCKNSSYPNDCLDKCRINSDAVENYPNPNPKFEENNYPKFKSNSPQHNTLSNNKSNSPKNCNNIIYIGIISLFVIFIILVLIFKYILP